jgi:hypothetical protein
MENSLTLLCDRISHTRYLTGVLCITRNWFKAKGEISSGAVEGMNLKAKLTMRKAFGFRTLKCLQIALYHELGKLPEPEYFHRFS